MCLESDGSESDSCDDANPRSAVGRCSIRTTRRRSSSRTTSRRRRTRNRRRRRSTTRRNSSRHHRTKHLRQRRRRNTTRTLRRLVRSRRRTNSLMPRTRSINAHRLSTITHTRFEDVVVVVRRHVPPTTHHVVDVVAEFCGVGTVFAGAEAEFGYGHEGGPFVVLSTSRRGEVSELGEEG